MDLNRLLFNHQISLMAQAGQIWDGSGATCEVDHYARLIEDFRDRESITEALLLGSREKRQ